MHWIFRVVLTPSLSHRDVRHNDHFDWSISSIIKMVYRHIHLSSRTPSNLPRYSISRYILL